MASSEYSAKMCCLDSVFAELNQVVQSLMLDYISRGTAHLCMTMNKNSSGSSVSSLGCMIFVRR